MGVTLLLIGEPIKSTDFLDRKFVDPFRRTYLKNLSQLHGSLLVGGWATPLKNMSSSIRMMKFPIYGKKCSKPPTSLGFELWCLNNLILWQQVPIITRYAWDFNCPAGHVWDRFTFIQLKPVQFLGMGWCCESLPTVINGSIDECSGWIMWPLRNSDDSGPKIQMAFQGTFLLFLEL